MVTMVQVDGIEDDKTGLDLYEMAEVLLEMGMAQAVVRQSIVAGACTYYMLECVWCR